MEKKSGSGAAALIVMVLGLLLGFIIGRGLEFYDRDDDFDDDFDLDLFND